MCTGINKLARYHRWRSGYAMEQTFIPFLTSDGFKTLIDYVLRDLQEPEELESIEVFPYSCLRDFISGLSSLLFFYGNAFLTADTANEQVHALELDEVSGYFAMPSDFRLEVLENAVRNYLHLRLPPLDSDGLGASFLDPVADRLDSIIETGAPITTATDSAGNVAGVIRHDQVTWTTIAQDLGFVQVSAAGVYAPLGAVFNGFLNDVETQVNSSFAPWVFHLVNAPSRELVALDRFDPREPVPAV